MPSKLTRDSPDNLVRYSSNVPRNSGRQQIPSDNSVGTIVSQPSGRRRNGIVEEQMKSATTVKTASVVSLKNHHHIKERRN